MSKRALTAISVLVLVTAVAAWVAVFFLAIDCAAIGGQWVIGFPRPRCHVLP